MTVAASPGPTGSAHRGHSFALMVLGIAFFAMFLVVLMTQVQTNEAFITNAGQVSIYKPNWMIFMQIPNLVAGNLSTGDAIATIFGWGIELIYLGFVVGYEMLILATGRSGGPLGNIFKTVAWGIIVFDMWTDYNYGTVGSGIGGHIAFAVITSFIVGFFGTIGIHMIEQGWKRA